MLGTIGFENLHIECIIGELPEERDRIQSIFVSLKVDCDFSACSSSDHLDDTVDYVSLADDCKQEAIDGRYQMLETYACRVLDRILKRYPVSKASILVKKPCGLNEADHTFVELMKRKE